MNVKVIIAAHKPYRMPEDPLYLPLHVGKFGKKDIGFTGDDTGDNISEKNANYCELTGLYWAWKNLEAEAVGLAHYRRHFCSKRNGDKWSSVMTLPQVQELLKNCDILVPNKRRYYIETIKSHWLHTPQAHEEDFIKFQNLIEEKYPEYSAAFHKVMNRTWAHMFNMFIMKRDKLEEYCTWLFDVLFSLEKELDITGYPAMDARIYGFFGEFMTDIWLEKNGYPYKEVNVMFMEKQNWLKKGGAFLMRKIGYK